MDFLCIEHKKRFEDLKNRVKKFNVSDREENVVLFIIAGNQDLYNKAEKLYNFQEREFFIDVLSDEKGNFKIEWKIPLSSSEKNLITLAFDLYSANNNIYVYNLFSTLDTNNFELALRAITYRFDK